MPLSWFDRWSVRGRSAPRPVSGLKERLSLELCALVVPGRIRPMPGTWGSLLAALLAPFLFLPMAWGGRTLLLAAIFVVGGLAATIVERLYDNKDPSIVVVDELVGQWIAYFPFATLGPWDLAVGFLLFRIFDILKPPPVKSSETWLPEGFGIMLDDVLAGLYAMLGLWLVRMVALG